jgi:ribonuclease P protein component
VLKKKYRLTKRGSFSYFYRKGEGGQLHTLKLQFVRSHSLKVGFSVSNKIGKATVRNLVKRRLRAAVRGLIGQIAPAQIVFSAKVGIESVTYKQLEKDIRQLLERARLIVKVIN